MFRLTHRKISPRVVRYLPHGGLFIAYFSTLDVLVTFTRFCRFYHNDAKFVVCISVFYHDFTPILIGADMPRGLLCEPQFRTRVCCRSCQSVDAHTSEDGVKIQTRR